MQSTSALYKRLLSEDHSIETRLVIGESGLLVDHEADAITFGTGANLVRILVDQGGAEDGFTESVIFSLKTYHSLFSDDVPMIGGVVAGEIEVSMLNPVGTIPRMAQIILYIRLVSVDGTEHSDWINKGNFFIDTREITHNDNGLEILKIHGYDALAKAQMQYPSSSIFYPALDTAIVRECAKKGALDVEVDDRTFTVMNGGYRYGLPVGYSIGEVLSYIAISYCGNWVITDEGKLRLVTLDEVPKETRYLVDEYGYAITFGGERILV